MRADILGLCVCVCVCLSDNGEVSCMHQRNRLRFFATQASRLAAVNENEGRWGRERERG